MNEKGHCRRNVEKFIDREFFPLKDILESGASFIKYNDFRVKKHISHDKHEVGEEKKHGNQ